MIRERAIEAVRRILEAASFDVDEIGSGAFDLSAFRSDECLVVLCSDEPEEIERFNSTRYHVQIGAERGECLKLLVSFNTNADAQDCILWDSGILEEYAGKAVIASVQGERLPLDFKNIQGEEPVQEMTGPPIPHLPINFTRQQAELIAGIEGNCKCRFIPHWHYHFSSSGEKTFRDRVISFEAEGSGAISAINGLETDIDISAIDKSGIPSDSDVLTPTITKETAAEQVRERVAEELTQGVRVKQVSGDTIYYEDRIFAPEMRNINVEISLIYVPVWQIRGRKIVEVNANTGEILQMPMDEGVELI